MGALVALSIAVLVSIPYPEVLMSLRVATDVRTPVRLNGIQPPMVLGAQVVAGVYEEEFGVDAIITSSTDGEHGSGSLHYAGLALDFRTRHVPTVRHEELAEAVRKALGPEFDVVLHTTHLHVEYDVKST